jgi:hypothetical protein
VSEYYSDPETLFGYGAVIWRNSIIWVWRHYLVAAPSFWHSNIIRTLRHYLGVVLLFGAALLFGRGALILAQQCYSDAEPLFGFGAVIWRNSIIWVWRHYLVAAP